MNSEQDRKPKLFIIDDDASIRDSMRLLIETIGHSVECFSSAAEFLEFIESFDISDPVCLIVDVQMPEIGGIELLEKLSALGTQFPVIMTTGHGSPALKQEAKELGAVALLEKPFRPSELQEIIATSLKLDIGEKDMR